MIPFLTNTYEVFAPTLRGHWGGPALERLELSIPRFADDVERELDVLGWQTTHIAGNSLGGLLALELARRGRANTVTAFAPAGGWVRGSRAAIRLMLWFLSRYPLRYIIGPLQPALRHAHVRRRVLADVVRRGERVSEEDALLFTTAMAQCTLFHPITLVRALAMSADALHTIECPVRIFHCEHDRVVPRVPYGARWSEIPGAEIVSLPDVGHIPMVEAPQLVADCIHAHIAGIAQ